MPINGPLIWHVQDWHCAALWKPPGHWGSSGRWYCATRGGVSFLFWPWWQFLSFLSKLVTCPQRCSSFPRFHQLKWVPDLSGLTQGLFGQFWAEVQRRLIPQSREQWMNLARTWIWCAEDCSRTGSHSWQQKPMFKSSELSKVLLHWPANFDKKACWKFRMWCLRAFVLADSFALL